MYPRFILLVLGATWLLASPGHSETRRVKIRFEIDGKAVVGPREIEFYTTMGRRIARADIVNETFGVPVTVPMDPVEVRLRLAGRTLVFTDIYPSKFEGSWTVGIDTPPFDEENVPSIPLDLDPKEHWFVTFSPATGDGTRQVVSIPGGPDTPGKRVSPVGRQVAVCDLVAHPESFEGQKVLVSGTYRSAFESSDLYCLSCWNGGFGAIWVDFADDDEAKSPASSPRDDGGSTTNVVVEGIFESSRRPYGHGGYRFHLLVSAVRSAKRIGTGSVPEALPESVRKRVCQ